MHPYLRSSLAMTVFAVSVLARGQESRPASIDVPTIAPKPEDVGSIDGMLRAYYEVVSGPAGRPRQWARDRTLYIPGIRFVAMSEGKDGRLLARVQSHQEFVEAQDPVLIGGFVEREIHRVTKRFGNIAHVFSTYETRRTAEGPVTGRGVNSIELFWDGKRWWIASAIWDQERPDNPIPNDLLP
jgi:hypothetical protein